MSIPEPPPRYPTAAAIDSLARRFGLPNHPGMQDWHPKELALIEASGWREFPPRLPEQPIFYPVLNEEYATQIARDWNVRESGSGFVTRFKVDASFLNRYLVQTVGAAVHQELWVPAEELSELNRHIVGRSS